MRSRHFPLLAVLLLPLVAVAQDDRKYQCSYGGLERRIEIVSEGGLEVPCEVHYFKDTEAPGEQQVLWTAQNEAGYCEARARELIARLEGMGWSCGAGGGEPAAPAPEATDDTDALVPAGDDMESDEQR